MEYVEVYVESGIASFRSKRCNITNAPNTRTVITILEGPECIQPSGFVDYSTVSYTNVKNVKVFRDIRFDKELPYLPSSVTFLDINTYRIHSKIHMPEGLKRLLIHTGYKHMLPDLLCLEELGIRNNDFPLGDFPMLKKLAVGQSFTGKIQKFPPLLMTVEIVGYKYRLPRFHSNITKLSIERYNYEINLPPYIRYLSLNSYYYPIQKIPPTLKTLGIFYYKHELPKLPKNLKEIMIDYAYPKLIKIPPRLRTMGCLLVDIKVYKNI